MTQPMVLMDKVTKCFRIADQDVAILKGIDLDVRQGEFVAVMGPSGSGKTTLMNLIGCLDVPTDGRYTLAGRDVTKLTDDELSVIRNEHIGFVFQNFCLIPYATVYENVLLPSLYTMKSDNDAAGRAADLLRMVGLEHRTKSKPALLSGGEQQRAGIARALINSPELLLADEPTGQLDSRTAEDIMKLFVRMNADHKTVIIITHDPHIAGYASRIVRIKDGLIET
ncbi:MAG: ABC transporter ATP-binding protein [Deltaproteobacteria bacterium]|nr:ABC transporter ATP-binding protein [Deltaproteobacteria bacterium]